MAEIEIDAAVRADPARTRKAMLRIKALLGETYVELTPGTGDGPMLEDGGAAAAEAAIEEAVEIDEIISLFDKATRRNFQGWIRELADGDRQGPRARTSTTRSATCRGSWPRGDDVLERARRRGAGAAAAGAQLGPRRSSAVNERRGQLRELIGNANDFFGALASRNESLAEAVFIFPTFLDESRATLRAAARPSRATPGRWCATCSRWPTRPAAHAARRRPAGARPQGAVPRPRPADRRVAGHAAVAPRGSCAGAEPLFEGLHPYLPELNPILSFLNFQQEQVADFIMNGAGSSERHAAAAHRQRGPAPLPAPVQRDQLARRWASHARARPTTAATPTRRPTTCAVRARSASPRRSTASPPAAASSDPSDGEPPCFVAPKSLCDGGQFPRLAQRRGRRAHPTRRATWARQPADPVSA